MDQELRGLHFFTPAQSGHLYSWRVRSDMGLGFTGLGFRDVHKRTTGTAKITHPLGSAISFFYLKPRLCAQD